MPEETLEQAPLIQQETPENEVHVDLEPEDGGSPVETPAAPAEEKPAVVPEAPSEAAADKKPRKRNSAEERISKLTKEISDAAAYAMEKEREANEYKSMYVQLQEKNKFLTEASIVSYEKEAQEKLDRAKVDLKRAIDAGDTDAAVDAQERLAEAKALQGQVATYKVQQRGSAPAKPAPQAQQPQQSELRNPIADGWIDRNSWVKHDSEDYNPEKAQDALKYAENLAAELHRNGRGAEVGTRRYFETIDKYMKDAWEEEEEVASALPPTKKAGSPVAAQTRGPAAPAKPDQLRITLSPDEQRVAVMLNLRDQNGNVLSKEEHFKAYARSKAADGKHAARDAAMAQRR